MDLTKECGMTYPISRQRRFDADMSIYGVHSLRVTW
ncbi:hypothetical protein H4W81_004277 [Nonomuraea africana]|uniref:Uncharacterized protein n=1 Tax=Nonomuraea africana TaxID=46171 RepID=A0ABR9KHK7_9ACTN|nr:hypothetical protein [Nonomuraea africana]